MPSAKEAVVYCWRPLPKKDTIAIYTTKGSYINTITCPDYLSVVVQGEQVIFTTKAGRNVIWTVRGSLRGTF
jgi:hypothetical protein